MDYLHNNNSYYSYIFIFIYLRKKKKVIYFYTQNYILKIISIIDVGISAILNL